jgi:hypothetical protein
MALVNGSNPRTKALEPQGTYGHHYRNGDGDQANCPREEVLGNRCLHGVGGLGSQGQ